MDPHLLRTLVAVVRHATFSAAARELGYTQSAVSQHIAALEHDLGTPLLTRRPVAPTRAGARLVEHAGPILARLAAARADVVRLAAAPPGRLRIGTAPLALHLAFQNIATVRVSTRHQVVSDLLAGAIDIGFVDGVTAPNDPLRLPDLGPLPAAPVAVAEGPLLVALPPGHPLAGRAALRLADLADARWIDAPDAAVPLADLRAVTGLPGFRPALRLEGTSVPVLAALVAAGHGLALLPASAGVPGVVLGGPRLVHRIEMLTSPGRSPAEDRPG